MPLHGEIEIELAVVSSGVAAERNQSSANVGGETFDLQAILVEDQGAIDVAQSAGQVGVSDGAVVDLQPSLHGRPGGRARNRHVNRDYAGRGEIGIEALNKPKVDAALGAQVQRTSAGELHRPACRQIGALANQMELFNFEELAGDGKANWAIVVNFDVLHIGIELAEIAGYVQFMRLTQRTL